MLSAVDGGKHPICFSQCPTNLFLFQSTHPSGVRPQWHGRYHRRQLISIHAPQWGATQALNASCLSTVNFNPRTPVGCDHVERTLDLGRAISIHAPQWGATIQRVHVNLPLAISIHAPQWGATVINYGWPGHNIFQSTHPSGVRPSRNQHPWESRRYFNPRTPVGCDYRSSTTGYETSYFNPRTPVGCDPMQPSQKPTHSLFQSTHPSGVRPMRELPDMLHGIFQSTHPSGVRPSTFTREPDCYGISIHAPQWGATRSRLQLVWLGLFQSTHPSGVRRHQYSQS